MTPRRGGRGRTLSHFTLDLWTLDILQQGAVLKTIRRLEYKEGYARKEKLFKSLIKQGLTDKEVQKHLRQLIREGDVYSPRVDWYRRTSYQPRKRKRRK